MSPLRAEVHRRLLFAKYLFTSGGTACGDANDQFSFTKGLLLFHDAADNALGAVADHLGAAVTEKMTLPQLFEPIMKADPQHRPIPYVVQLSALNAIRNGAKHKGIFPDVKSNLHFPSTLEEFLTAVCREYLDVSFDDLSLKSLLTDEKVLKHLNDADLAIKQQRWEMALICLAFAVYRVCEAGSVFGLRPRDDGRTFDWVEPFAVNHAVTLLTDGIDVKDYYRFKRLTPRIAVMREEAKPTYSWDKHYGHAGNWTEENVRFCYRICVDAALKGEEHARSEPKLIDYYALFEDVVTPLHDGVPVYDFPRPTNPWEVALRPEPRKVIATLNKGDVIVGWATDSTDHFDEWFLISSDLTSRTSTGWRHGYVDKADVGVKQRPLADADS